MHRLRFVGPYVGRNGTNDGKSEIRSVQETTLIFAVFEDHLMIGLLQNEPTLSWRLGWSKIDAWKRALGPCGHQYVQL